MNTGLKEYTEKLRLGIVTPSKKLNPIEKFEQNPTSLKFAIHAMCFDCSGYEYSEVRNCEFKDCPLYGHRKSYKIKPDKKINIPRP